MAKSKTTTGWSKASGQRGKPSAALPASYATILADLKTRVRAAQLRAAVSVNRGLIALYWDIGRVIVEQQKKHKWGDGVIDRLSRDLAKEFPQIAGFSLKNLYRMRAFYLGYAEANSIVAQAVRQLPETTLQEPVGESKPQILSQAVRELPEPKLSQPVTDSSIVAQLVRQTPDSIPSQVVAESFVAPPEPVASLPWGHNVVLLQKVKSAPERFWYARKAVEHGWSRAMLTHHIEAQLHKREGKAVTNFQRTLPPPQSDLAEQTLKDPYNFDFLTLRSDAHERDLELGLLDHIQKFLLELGVGFAFVGRQHHMEIGGQDYYLDLLFYHLRLRNYVVIDLKMKAFEPEFAGKMNFYLSAVDDQLRHTDDKPSIGLLLCKERDHLTVEYALRDLKKPIGVAQWQTKLVESLPKNLKGSLPTIKEIESELSKRAETK
jgi:predicted nuclease of restriction endonuclease-like (RecB) superfamily